MVHSRTKYQVSFLSMRPGMKSSSSFLWVRPEITRIMRRVNRGHTIARNPTNLTESAKTAAVKTWWSIGTIEADGRFQETLQGTELKRDRERPRKILTQRKTKETFRLLRVFRSRICRSCPFNWDSDIWNCSRTRSEWMVRCNGIGIEFYYQELYIETCAMIHESRGSK